MKHFIKKIRRKSWSNVPPKLVACIGFSIQSCTQNRPSPKFQSLSRDLILTFLNRLDYLHEIWHTCSACSWLQNVASDFLIFAWGLSYGLSKVEKKGVKSSLNFERS